MMHRPRRNRKNAWIRTMVAESHLRQSDLIAPLFVIEGRSVQQPIPSMPGHYRFSIDRLLLEIKSLQKMGIGAVALFPVIESSLKDQYGSEALYPHGLLPRAISAIKQECPELTLITDVALDPYTSHGHDGLVNEFYEIDNDATLEILGKQALIQAEAGADIIAPSDMMDGRIGHIRSVLDERGLTQVSLLSYAAKYASSLYFPFRGAMNSSLAFGDKKTYQMNPANQKEALWEAKLDEQEGADLLMVKPASLYLDVIDAIRKTSLLPVGGYHVSGEYAMVMAAEEKGYLSAEEVFYETLLSLKRAGASFIFSYAAKMICQSLSPLEERAQETAPL